MKKMIAAALAAAIPIDPAAAMNVADFLQRAEALEQRGMMAVFSSDYKALKAEVQTASGQLRAERLAAQKAGRKPAYCPPPKGGLTPKELLAHFRKIPATQRLRTDVKDGLRSLLVSKYPCR
jgi:hypothetical protein